MKSWLKVECEKLDETLLAKHLQLRGAVVDSAWRFEMPSRLLGRPVSRHIQHWTNLLQKHGDGRRALQRFGYSFSLHFSSAIDLPLTIPSAEIELLARNHCGLVFEKYDAA